jgi:hypothetical protein
MKMKSLVSAALLLFVGVSVAYLVAGEPRQNEITTEMPNVMAGEEDQTLKPTQQENPIITPDPTGGRVAQAVESAHKENPTIAAVATDIHDNQAGEPAQQEIPATNVSNHKVIAYYFYGTKRCRTCLTIEAYTEEALREAFPDALNAGLLEWKPMNVALPENEHFIRDYELTTRSVVLLDMWDGKQKQWKNLTRVWELVRDKSAFVSYVEAETKSYLDEGND